jgi:2-aminoethylphosphonate-pyruvate transaminase
MLVDLVVFDIAGTTVYDGDAVHRCLAEAIALAGVTVSRDAINRVMGMPKPDAIATLVRLARETPPDAAEVADLYAAFERIMIEHYRVGIGVREADGASEVMRRLRAAGVKIALDTGFARSITDVVVARLGWGRDVVDVTVSSDEVARGRPHPDLLLEAMRRTGVGDPSRVAKVGDTPADLLEGTAAACGFVVGVTSGSHGHRELAGHPHTHLIASLRELLPIVDPATVVERAPGDTSTALLFTPGPLTTSAAVKHAMLRDVGSRDREFLDVVARVRTKLLQVVNTSTADGFEAIVLQGSGTYAVEAMLSTFVQREGAAKLLVVDNGAYGARMADIARVLGIDVVVLAAPPDRPVAARAVAGALAGARGFTHVGVVHCETTTGVLNPIREIGAAVHAAGCVFIVDAMSSFGGIQIDARGDHIDALASSANKCLEGVPGCAFVIATRELLQSARPARSVVLDLGAQWRGFERDGQFRFTPPTHVVLALDRALAELEFEGGVPARAARYHANHARLVAGMRAAGFAQVVAPEHQSDVITAFLCPVDPCFTFDEFYERLRRRNFVIYPGKVAGLESFRIGTIGRLYPADIDALVAAIVEVMQELRIDSDLSRSATDGNVADAVAEFFARSGAELYFGEPVTQLEHALQCAALAQRAGARPPLVVAALLHDVGHLLHGRGESLADAGIDGQHEVVGHRWLTRFFGADVTEPVRLHVDAKRYLCATDPDYFSALSPASRRSLALQGGPLAADELSEFADSPFALDAVRLRRWDDGAKTPGVAVPALEHYRSLLLTVARTHVAS